MPLESSDPDPDPDDPEPEESSDPEPEEPEPEESSEPDEPEPDEPEPEESSDPPASSVPDEPLPDVVVTPRQSRSFACSASSQFPGRSSRLFAFEVVVGAFGLAFAICVGTAAITGGAASDLAAVR